MDGPAAATPGVPVVKDILFVVLVFVVLMAIASIKK
jgi:hypothetical protein